MKTRLQKEENVAELTEKLQRARSVVFANYQGLTMSQLSILRNSLSEQGAEFAVTKNTLLERALQASDLPISDSIKSGPTATLFSYQDEITPIKALVKAFKDASIGQVKSGILDGQILDEYAIVRLANLPSKAELQAKVVGSLASPLYGIVGVLQANIRNLVYTVEAIRVQKGGEAQA